MNQITQVPLQSRRLLLACLVLCQLAPAIAQTNFIIPNESFPDYMVTNHIGWKTNGPLILEELRFTKIRSSPTNSQWFQIQHRELISTNPVFAGYRPESLANVIWTNFIAHTNGRGGIL